MLITFKSEAYTNITMFGDVAQQLLKMMGRNASSQGVIPAEEVSSALQRLQSGVSSAPTPSPSTDSKDDDKDNEPVSLAKRAIPLIEMLTAAAKENCEVKWIEGG